MRSANFLAIVALFLVSFFTDKSSALLLAIVAEMCIQIGHVAVAMQYASTEKGRSLDDIRDELADVLLQSLVFSYVFELDTNTILKNVENNKEQLDESDLLLKLFHTASLLTESAMRFNGKRFPQYRNSGDIEEYEFFQENLLKITALILSYCHQHKIDLYDSFIDMSQSALNFLESYSEYILNVEALKDKLQKNSQALGKRLKDIQNERGKNGTH